ncbi:MAG: ABC transporter substrate-binding protein [Desulfobulbaceae bacterium]|nr:ABC transporter substrate-binding protein [Desulfobulbaceae bacterium]
MRNIFYIFVVLIIVVLGFITRYIAREKKHQTDIPRVGHLYLSNVDKKTFDGFKDGMAQYGFMEGKTIHYISNDSVGDIEKLQARADALVKSGVDLIFVSSTPATMAIREATRNSGIPVLFCPVNDPVGSGIVKDISHPGENITGIRLAVGDQKRFQLLKEIVPGVEKVFFPYTAHDKSALKTLLQIEQIADKIGINIVKAPVIKKEDVDAMMKTIPPDVDAIFLPRDSIMESRIDTFVQISFARKLPISAPSSLQADAGALYSYGHSHYQLGIQAARLGSQILGGTDPGNLPVETAKYFFDINLKTAELIGLTITDEVLRQADRIIR